MAIFDKKGIPITTKKDTHSRSFTDTALIPILPPEEILTLQKRANQIDNLVKFTRLPRKWFDELYLAAIHNFAAFSQRLAAVKGAKYDGLGGAVDLSLERAHHSLEQYCRYLKDNGIYPPTFSMQQELWSYVIFTASLFYDVGRLAEFYQVKIFDDERNEIMEWLPAKENMAATGAYYHADKRMLEGHEYIHEMTVIMARRLIPEKGFEWIVSQRAALETWLQLLASELDDEDGTRSLFMSLILWVDNYLIAGDDPGGGQPPRPTKKYTVPMAHFHMPMEGGMNTLYAAGAALSAEQGPGQANAAAEGTGQFPNLGGDFLAWLRQGLASGSLSYNSAAAMLQVVREGMIFRGTQLYNQFLNEKGLIGKVSVHDLERAFQQLGISDGNMVKVQAGNDPKNVQNWNLIPQAQSVFSEIKLETQPHFQMLAVARAADQYQWVQDLQARMSPAATNVPPGGKG